MPFFLSQSENRNNISTDEYSKSTQDDYTHQYASSYAGYSKNKYRDFSYGKKPFIPKP